MLRFRLLCSYGLCLRSFRPLTRPSLAGLYTHALCDRVNSTHCFAEAELSVGEHLLSVIIHTASQETEHCIVSNAHSSTTPQTCEIFFKLVPLSCSCHCLPSERVLTFSRYCGITARAPLRHSTPQTNRSHCFDSTPANHDPLFPDNTARCRL